MNAAELRQYRAAGGVAAWPIPILSGALALGALALDTVELALTVCLLGFLAQSYWRGGAVEISSVGLTRGFLLNGRFLGRTTVMTWDTITSIHTDWRCPGDDTALVTVVRDAEGRAIRLSTAMGLHAYWACLAAIASRAPGAARGGLTHAVLSEAAPGRRTLLSAAATAGALALVVVAVVGVHYLWAQGRSSALRQLERAIDAPEPRGPAGRS